MTAPRRLAPTPGTTYRAQLVALLAAMDRVLDPTVVAAVKRAWMVAQADEMARRAGFEVGR